MEIIKRKINLSEVLNYADEENWGKIAESGLTDYIINGTDEPFSIIGENIPIFKDKSGTSVLRFATMMTIYQMLRNFYQSYELYQVCNRKGGKKLVKTDIDLSDAGNVPENIILCDENGIPDDAELGTYICVYGKYEEINTIFYKDGDDKAILRAAQFYGFVESKRKHGGDYEGHFDIPIYMEQTLEDIGVYMVDEESNSEETRHYDSATITGTTTDYDSATITGTTTESKLYKFKRTRTEVDDSGNTLPFILQRDNSGGTEYNAELVYTSGLTNIQKIADNLYSFDYMEEPEDSGDTMIFRYGLDNVAEGDEQLNEIYEKCNKGEFKIEDCNGIKYEEIHPFVEKKEKFIIDCNEREITYRQIMMDGVEAAFAFEKDAEDLNILPTFKDDFLMGFIDSKIDTSDFYIDRGTASAYERHNSLGEVATMEDLVKYKNGFFEIKNDENKY